MQRNRIFVGGDGKAGLTMDIPTAPVSQKSSLFNAFAGRLLLESKFHDVAQAAMIFEMRWGPGSFPVSTHSETEQRDVFLAELAELLAKAVGKHTGETQ